MGVDELLNRRRQHGGPVEGEVANDPDDVGDPIHVYVVGLQDNDEKIGPCAWTPRGDEWPSKGDPCAVAFTEAETPVIVAWWPERWPGG